MSTKQHAPGTDPEFFPENVEFHGVIGGWGYDFGLDTYDALFSLIRTKDLDWLEEIAKYSGTTRRHCVLSVPRHGSKRNAATRLLDARVRSRVHYEYPTEPYQSGLLTKGELRSIVRAVAEERKRNIRAAEEKQRRHEAPIIKLARELGLYP